MLHVDVQPYSFGKQSLCCYKCLTWWFHPFSSNIRCDSGDTVAEEWSEVFLSGGISWQVYMERTVHVSVSLMIITELFSLLLKSAQTMMYVSMYLIIIFRLTIKALTSLQDTSIFDFDLLRSFSALLCLFCYKHEFSNLRVFMKLVLLWIGL